MLQVVQASLHLWIQITGFSGEYSKFHCQVPPENPVAGFAITVNRYSVRDFFIRPRISNPVIHIPKCKLACRRALYKH